MRIKLDLDEQTTNRLVEIALAEKRPLAWQLEISHSIAFSGDVLSASSLS
jgi:hypothetical protein